MTSAQPSCDIFCRVVDNFGDIGVTWRLARQLAHEYHLPVRLFVDDMASFARIAPSIDVTRPEQTVDAVTIVHWLDGPDEAALPKGVADLVIEAFACQVPAVYLRGMAARVPAPVWFNLEYLSAEPWVATHHLLPSPHPTQPLTKHFFFPGFDAGTGGLIRESGRTGAHAEGERAGNDAAIRIFVFGYPGAPLAILLDAIEANGIPAIVTIAEGELSDGLSHWRASQDKTAREAAPVLEFHIAPFVPQQEFDSLLRYHDILFVRGEDSFVRAQWAAKPFVWQIYPQSDGAHWLKLNAFLDRYCLELDPESAVAMREMWRAWNAADAAAIAPAWRGYCDALPVLRKHALAWAQQLEKVPDLASNLLRFYRKIAKI